MRSKKVVIARDVKLMRKVWDWQANCDDVKYNFLEENISHEQDAIEAEDELLVIGYSKLDQIDVCCKSTVKIYEFSKSLTFKQQRVLRYLRGSLDHGMMFKKVEKMELIGYTDSDWASSIDDMRKMQLADILTKALPKARFDYLKNLIGLL
ncbi:hypothetical protein GH714_022570 [Hevea brasiliensis]|uniref:Uncharacterized protein n=1 Tax=Hevea brasiliensis TaxID=3981 RepID=A0A6A6L7G2_HEVBR|nr:hypothetical protein GH714_022570 [Hevea brasiliensis]